MPKMLFKSTKPQFSGHETFPLRQLWLRKAFDAVTSADEGQFSDDAAIARFGVGKNMVSAIRFWATACHIIREGNQGYEPTDLGISLLDPVSGLDPYSEQSGTTWLMHWILASTPDRTTTWYYVFNHMPQQVFERSTVVEGLVESLQNQTSRVSAATLKRDVECCIRSYVPKVGNESPEEMSEPLLGELGLIQQNARGAFEFRRGAKRSLPDGVFAYALLDYWERLEHSGAVLAFDRVALDYGSPGRVFKLDEDSIAERLIALEKLSDGELLWTEQAGIRQVTRKGRALHSIKEAKTRMLHAAYSA